MFLYSLKRQKSEKVHRDGDILWRKTSSEHENPEFGGKKLSAKASHKHHSDKKCNHEEDDILWRETVSHQNFITTSPHSFIPSDETTVTPLRHDIQMTPPFHENTISSLYFNIFLTILLLTLIPLLNGML